MRGLAAVVPVPVAVDAAVGDVAPADVGDCRLSARRVRPCVRAACQSGSGHGCSGEQQELTPLDRHLQNDTRSAPGLGPRFEVKPRR